MAESNLSGEGLDQLLSRTRQALESVRGQGSGSDEPAEGKGSAHDDLITVTATSPGQITAVELDPRAMRLPSEELAEDIRTAVNAALSDLRNKAVEATMPADLDALNQQLADLHTESIQQMERFTSAIGGAVAQIKARGGAS